MTTLEQICNPMPFALAAWKALLEKAGHTVWSVAAFDEPPPNAKSLSPYLEIQITSLRAGGLEYPFNDGTSVWASWAGELVTRASTMRGKNGDKHIALVGAIYALGAQCKRGFLFTPYHVLKHFRPSGLTSNTDGLLDQSEIHMEIHILVRDSAWGDA